MAKSSKTIPALILAFGGGLTYWVMSNRDTTPVGLTTTKTVKGIDDNLDNGIQFGSNGDDTYTGNFVLGTFRASKDTLPISSDDEDKPLLVILKNGEPIEAEIINKSDLVAKPNPTESLKVDLDEQKRIGKNLADLMEKYAVKYDTDAQEQIKENRKMFENKQEAESIFGPTMTLQSHFVW